MPLICGSIIGISLDAREFDVPADVNLTYNIGGNKTERLPNGNGTSRNKVERVLWKIANCKVSSDTARQDPEFLQNLANGPDFAVIVTFADETTLTGTGGIEGDLSNESMDGVAAFELSGEGTLTS